MKAKTLMLAAALLCPAPAVAGEYRIINQGGKLLLTNLPHHQGQVVKRYEWLDATDKELLATESQLRELRQENLKREEINAQRELARAIEKLAERQPQAQPAEINAIIIQRGRK